MEAWYVPFIFNINRKMEQEQYSADIYISKMEAVKIYSDIQSN